MKARFSILCLDHTFSPEQKKLIDAVVLEHHLRVFSYVPTNAYMIGDGEQMAFIEEYAFPGKLIPFIRDCVGGTRCSFDVPVEMRTTLPIGFTLYLFGTRKSDEHWSFGERLWPSKTNASFYAPIWDWTYRDVQRGLKKLGVKKPTIDTGNFEACVECLSKTGKVFCPKEQKEIDSVNWQPTAMLSEFREKYGVINQNGTKNN